MPPSVDPTQGLAAFMDDVRTQFNAKHAAREQSLALCRDALRHSANAIRAVHRSEFDGADKLLAEARAMLEQAGQALADHQDIFYAGFVHNAAKEFVEGCITLAIIAGRPLPSPADLGVEPAAYANGLGEAVGELRRYLLDGLRRGDLSRGEELLAAMDDIYSVLVTMDFPDAITGGLRRTTDMVRGVLEKTRSDLTLTIRQKELEEKLEDFQDKAG